MIRIALYKRQKDKHYFDDIIWQFQKLTRDPDPQYIHVELDFGTEMFSSSGRRKDNGVRYVTTKALDLCKWDFFDLKVTPDKEREIRAETLFYTGLGYDYLGIVGMALPFNIQFGSKWYCSEVVNHVLYKCSIVKKNRKIRPSQILQSYREQGVI